MATQSEPIQMPKMPKYKPQVNIQPDDPDTYMMLVPANINTKLPILQIAFCALAILFAIIALSVDEMSDGDIKFSSGDPEVDYDCGWNQYRLNIAGYSESHDYASDSCSNDDEVIDADFCAHSAMNGKIWLASSIIGLFTLVASIIIILNKTYGGKDSWIYTILLLVGTGCISIAAFWWWLNDRCEDVEQYNEIYLEADFDTSPGPSLYLMWVSLFMCIGAVLITSLHMCNRIQREYYPQRNNANVQSRVQTHIVN
eukprot:810758_1